MDLKAFILTILLFFSPSSSSLPSPVPAPVITIITTGDVIPARTVNWKMTQYNDFTYPFAKTADFLKNADLTIINLEAPLVPNCPITQEGMVFAVIKDLLKV